MKQSLTKLLVSIQNIQLVKKSFLFKKHYNKVLLDFLWDKGFLKNYSCLSIHCFVSLRYKQDQTIIKSFNISSNKNYSIYLSMKKLWKIRFVKTLFVLSTALGVFSLIECKKIKVGGKIIVSLN